MDGRGEGWKGCLCLNHRFHGLHGLRGEEGDKKEWMEVCKVGSVEGWKDGRMEGMSLSEPRITQITRRRKIVDWNPLSKKRTARLETEPTRGGVRIEDWNLGIKKSTV